MIVTHNQDYKLVLKNKLNMEFHPKFYENIITEGFMKMEQFYKLIVPR